MKKDNKRTGFTLVELLVVIAILAVLASVSVVGYLGFVKKARVSNDTGVIAQMNTTLQANEAVDGGNDTAYDAIIEIEDAGFDVNKLSPTTEGYFYAFDISQNRMFLLDGNYNQVVPDNLTISNNKIDVFVLAGSESEVSTFAEKGYSAYLKNGFSWSDETKKEITTSKGIDVGENEVSTINYTNTSKQTVVFRSDSYDTTLNINGPSDTVYHYGEALAIEITAVDPNNSYHEHGNVSWINIKKGHIVTEDDSKVTTLIASPINATDVTFDISKEGNLGTIGTTISGVNLPSKNELPSGTVIQTVEEVNKKIEEQEKLDGSKGLGTKESPYLIQTAEQFNNIGNLNDEMKANEKHFKLINDIDLRDLTSFNTFEYNQSNQNYSKKAISKYFNGSLDGDNHKLISNDSLDYIFVSSKGNATFKNINYYYLNKTLNLCSGQYENSNTTFDNVNLYTLGENTYIELGKNNGLFTDWVGYNDFDRWGKNVKVNIVDCDVYVNIKGSSYNSVFFGGSLYYSNAEISDSNYYGNYYGEYVNLILGNGAKYISDNYLIAKNVSNKGVLAGTNGMPAVGGRTNGNDNVECSYIKQENVNIGITRNLSNSSLNLSLNADKKISITDASDENVEYYELSFNGGTRLVYQGAENSSFNFKLKISKNLFTNGIYQTNYKDGKMATVKQYKEKIDSDASFNDSDAIDVYGDANAKLWVIEKDNTFYYVFDFNDNDVSYFITKSNSNNVDTIVDINNVDVLAFDKDELPIAQKTLKL